MVLVSRFAPSPTGRLHLGHAYSAWWGWSAARRAPDGRFLLRIEDIDRARCRPAYEALICEDLLWLGLAWDGPVRRQSEHFPTYRAGLDRLRALGVLYPCFCSRREIEAELARSAAAPHPGPSGLDGPAYPGTCRALPPAEAAARVASCDPHAWRLDGARALALTGPLSWHDAAAGRVACDPLPAGDVVLARRDAPASYHLCVTLDDALQGVTLVTRGEDLFHATHIHRLLQALLDLPVPDYSHHRLLLGPDGRRLAKRDAGVTLADLRAEGVTPGEIWARLGVPGP